MFIANVGFGVDSLGLVWDDVCFSVDTFWPWFKQFSVLVETKYVLAKALMYFDKKIIANAKYHSTVWLLMSLKSLILSTCLDSKSLYLNIWQHKWCPAIC